MSSVAFLADRSAQDTVLRQAQDQLESNRDAAIRAVGREAEENRRVVTAWASQPELVEAMAGRLPDSPARLQRLLESLALAHEQAPVTFAVTPAGRTQAVFPSSPASVGKDFSFRDWYEGVSRTDQAYVSSAYQSAATGKPLIVAVAAPVRDNGRLLGYIAAGWGLASVADVVAGSARDDGVALTVTDQTGQAITGELDVDARGEAVTPKVSDPVRRALAGANLNVAGEDELLSAVRVGQLGWTVTARIDRDVATASAVSFRSSLARTVLLAIVMLALLAAWWLRLVARRERELADREQQRRELVTLFMASPIGIVESTPDGVVVAANDSVTGLLGHGRRELIGMQLNDLLDDGVAGLFAAGRTGVADGAHQVWTEEGSCRGRDGHVVPVLLSVAGLRDSDERLYGLVTFVVDLTAQKHAEAELAGAAERLAERERFLSTLIETIDVSVVGCDARGQPNLVNAQARRTPGLTAGLDGAPALERRKSPTRASTASAFGTGPPDDAGVDAAQAPLRQALLGMEVRDAELVLADQQGNPVSLLANARPLRNADGAVVGAVLAAHDITAIRQAQLAVTLSEGRLRRIFDEALVGEFLTDTAGIVIRVNNTFAALLDVTQEALLGRQLLDLFLADPEVGRLRDVLADPTARLHTELRLAHRDGSVLHVRVALLWLEQDTDSPVLLVQVEDITARRSAEAKLTEMALHDELTGLPNRRLLTDRCMLALGTAAGTRQGSTRLVGLLYLDLDGFKPVNDGAGHEAGDRLLVDVGRKLRDAVRPSDTVARVGGDEFVVLVPQLGSTDELRHLADRLGAAARTVVTVAGVPLEVSASIGAASVDMAQERDITPEQLLRRADVAMYRAKSRGKARHDVYDDELHASTEARRELETTMRDGLANERISMVFQPVIEVDTGLVVGAEALMRARDRHGRMLPTLPCVLAAEAAGLSDALSTLVLFRALRAAASWPQTMHVAVNISARELTSKDLRGRVERALAEHGVAADRLVLEITETAMLAAGPSALRELEHIRSLGVRISIDDFGTAYATLANLTTLPIDVLKVDTSFTAGLPDQPVHTAIVHGVASMAYELGIPCVVEGVETTAQLDALRGLTVYAQGWLWGQPAGEDVTPSASSISAPRSPLGARPTVNGT